MAKKKFNRLTGCDTLEPKTPQQKRLMSLMSHNALNFALGPAGTGKTYVATRMACDMLDRREVDRLIVTRPIVEAEEKIGFLPGGADEKIAPYFLPVRDVLQEHFGGSHVDAMLRTGQIEFAPLGFMRGRTFNNSIILLDEAQNTTPGQMKLFLTRVGEWSKICITGDPRQKDIPGPSGLLDALDRLRDRKEVGVVEFDRDDVVRSDLARIIVEAYEKPD